MPCLSRSQDSVAALGVFDEETLVSLELGWQLDWTQYDLRSRLALFTMDRDDQQAKGSLVIPRADGSTAFIDYTDNAAASEHRGPRMGAPVAARPSKWSQS
jgi:hypothetical protein